MQERGCDYCRADSNMFYGHVEQMAASDERRTVLLRCPQCGWLYEDDQRSDPSARQGRQGSGAVRVLLRRVTAHRLGAHSQRPTSQVLICQAAAALWWAQAM